MLDDFGPEAIDSDLGNNLLGGDPQLAPLGDYGGPTQTMIPLPGSLAINNAPDSTRTTDQRGIPITDGIPDIGAVEFQGDSDIQLAIPNIFDIDIDNDGTSVGVELAIGTDPFVSDPDNARKFALPVSIKMVSRPSPSVSMTSNKTISSSVSFGRQTSWTSPQSS